MFVVENTYTEGWMYEMNLEREEPSNTWFNRLLEDPAFVTALRERWQELREGLLSNEALDARIDTLAAPLPNAAARNFARWPNLSDQKVGVFDTPTNDTWEGQVQFMRDWLSERLVWMDAEWQ
jgi:hypothetical protein